MARHGFACLFAALFTAVLLGTADCGSAAEPGHRLQITPAELAERMRTRDALLILDVRSSREYAAGHIPEAVNIPFNELADRLGELTIDKSDEVVVYCLNGKRAALAEQVLTQASYTNARHLKGDMKAWQRGGYPTD